MIDDTDDFLASLDQHTSTPVSADITRDPVEQEAIAKREAEKVLGYVVHAVTGSCTVPGVVAKDLDVLVLVDAPWQISYAPAGYVSCMEYAEQDAFGDGWTAYRGQAVGCQDVNLILVHDAQFYARWVEAGRLCAELGATDRRLRVLIHEMHRDQQDWLVALERARKARQ
jgi:hypothetical protein